MEYTDRLETARLTTRFLTQEDAANWLEYCSDPIATRFTGMDGKTPEEMAREGIALSLKRYKENRFGLQALISKETGEFIGKCGLLLQEVNGRNEIEIGYHLLPRYWGHGYATEAAKKFRDYAFERHLTDSVVSIIHPNNTASKKVAMRIGMKLEETNAIFHGKEHELYRITRKEWDQQKTFYWSSLFSHSF
jgi:ribosomal-protein-alanine N-acetyltransferase